LAGEMFAQFLRHKNFTAQTSSPRLTAGELVGWVRESAPKLVCVSAIAPTTIIHVRYLCSKLRAAFPEMKILAGVWGSAKRSDEVIQALKQSGADEVLTTLADAATWVESQADLLDDRSLVERGKA
jgi:methylmalonyl-CoA mutase cobalamin-binding subunit